MIEKIAKYLILSLLGLCALTFAAALVIDDETIESTTGPAAGTLLDIKHGVYDTVSAKSESFVYWIRTTIHEVLNFSPTNRVPRVVMRIPPPPKEVERAPASESKAAPEPAIPESEPAGQLENMPAAAPAPVTTEPAMPATTESAMTQPPGTAEPMPGSAPMPETGDTPPAAPQSALGFGESAQDGAAAVPCHRTWGWRALARRTRLQADLQRRGAGQRRGEEEDRCRGGHFPKRTF